jgi:hypothetical protein
MLKLPSAEVEDKTLKMMASLNTLNRELASAKQSLFKADIDQICIFTAYKNRKGSIFREEGICAKNFTGGKKVWETW